jgi:DNA-directed RNA polymerase specialized sigma24 family protein
MTTHPAPDSDGVVAEHYPDLLRLAVLLTGDNVAAEEVTRDAFVRLRRRSRRIGAERAPAFLRAQVLTGARRVERRRRGGPRKGPEVPGQHRALLAAVDRLPHRQREVLVLHGWVGLSAPRIATTLGSTAGAVQQQLARALVAAGRAAVGRTQEQADVDEAVRVALEVRASAVRIPRDVADELSARLAAARRRRRRLLAGTAAAVVVLAAAGALTGALLRGHAKPRRAAAAPAYASPTHRSLYAGLVPVGEMGTFDLATGRRSGPATLLQARAVASMPDGRWLVARIGDRCGSTLSVVRENGIEVTLPTGTLALLSDIQVSPDGRLVAGVSHGCLDRVLLGVDVIDLSSGQVRRWAPAALMTAVSGLSWAPDSRQLAYTAGIDTGGGVGGGYAVLDGGGAPGRLSPPAPGTGAMRLGPERCAVDRGVWLGDSGRFAVFAYCTDSDSLYLAQVPFLSADPVGRSLAALPLERATLEVDASATEDGDHLLVTTDTATYRIDGGAVTRLQGQQASPAW